MQTLTTSPSSNTRTNTWHQTESSFKTISKYVAKSNVLTVFFCVQIDRIFPINLTQ